MHSPHEAQSEGHRIYFEEKKGEKCIREKETEILKEKGRKRLVEEGHYTSRSSEHWKEYTVFCACVCVCITVLL